MTGAFFVLVEMLRTSIREWARWAGFAGAVALMLASGSAMALLQGGGKEEAPGSTWCLVARVSEELSDQKLNELAWDLWALKGVERVSFRFPGDELPGGGSSEGRALLLWAQGEEAARSLKERIPHVAEGKVTAVELLSLKHPAPARLPPLSRVISLVALVFFAFLSLVLGRSAVARTHERWRNEWDLLRFAGLDPRVLVGLFLGVVILWSLLGCALYLVVYEGLRMGIGGIPGVREIAPGYAAGGAFPYLAAFIVGPAWATLAGGFALFLTHRGGGRPRASAA